MECIGIFVLVLVDAVMILAHIVPRGVAINTADKLVFAGLYLSYVASMAIAMYPGSGQRRSAVLDAAIDPSHPSLAAASVSFAARRIAPPLP